LDHAVLYNITSTLHSCAGYGEIQSHSRMVDKHFAQKRIS